MVPIVGFYTTNTPYEQEAFKMKASAIAVGLNDVNLFKVCSLGSWVRNCQQKVDVLLEACDKLKEPFLYVDVDARFRCFPELLVGEWLRCYDMGVHYFKNKELLSGTIWINPTVHTYNVLKMWQQECEEFPKEWDQRILEKVIKSYHAVDVYKLPAEYTWIDDPLPHKPNRKENLDAVIVHYQASRKFKQIIGK